MENDAHNNFSKQYSPLFGKTAVDMGFVTAEQLTEALAEQAEDGLSNKPHRFIGDILFEHGWITKDQIDFVVLEVLKLEEFLKWNSRST